jgi:hypothetical protein
VALRNSCTPQLMQHSLSSISRSRTTRPGYAPCSTTELGGLAVELGYERINAVLTVHPGAVCALQHVALHLHVREVLDNPCTA